MDFRISTAQETYGVRVTALITRDDQLLTYQVGDQHHLVGGAIEVGELSPVAVVREVREELGLDCRVGELALVAEHLFDYEGQTHHMIEFHYWVELHGEAPHQLLDGEPYVCQWLPLDQLSAYDVRPRFLKTVLPAWQGQVVHVVNDERL